MPSQPTTIQYAFATQTGNVPASQLDADFQTLAGQANNLTNQANYFVDTGTLNSYAITVTSPLAVALTPGLVLNIMLSSTNTVQGAVLTVNALPPAQIIYPGVPWGGSNAVLPGQLRLGAVVTLVYDGTYFEYQGPMFGSGSFAPTWTGFASGQAPAQNVNWAASGLFVNLTMPNTDGTSNATTMAFTNLPTYLQTSRAQGGACGIVANNGNSYPGTFAVTASSSTVNFLNMGATNGLFTPSGSKGFAVTYANCLYSII
jgi:hypothetical protein